MTGLLSLPAHADYLDFYFTTMAGGGTITGEIEGLSDNATSSPTDVVIFSQPPGFVDGPGDLFAMGYGFYNGENNLTVTSGQITGADLGLVNNISGGDYQGYGFDVSELGYTGANGIYQTVGGVATGYLNNSGFAGTLYTPVPEPRQEALLFLLGAAVLVSAQKAYVWHARRRAAPVIA